MKRLFFLLPIIVALLLFAVVSVNAESEFETYLSNFYQNQEKATKILKEIETDLKNGSKHRQCARQREAASYGIKAMESLIKAFSTSDSPASQMEKLQAGLNKWRELRDYC